MAKFQTVFKRYEKKYIITKDKADLLMNKIGDRLSPDKYGRSTVCNIYFDTPDYRIIRHSMEKGVFKEKLRVRSYNCPDADSIVFVELKKKYKGVVYKRRVSMKYSDAIKYLIRGTRPEGINEQVLNEIDYFIKFYPSLQPRVSLFYDRIAFYCKEDKNLRITFDTNIRYRTSKLDISQGSEGTIISENNTAVMEIKCVGSMPLWLTKELSALNIFPSSFSKYGKAYSVFLPAQNEKLQQTTKSEV